MGFASRGVWDMGLELVRDARRPSPARGSWNAGLLGWILIALTSLAGCASYTYSPFVPGDELARPLLAGIASGDFDYVDHLPHPRYESVIDEADYWVGSLAFPSVGENGQDEGLVTARYFRGKDSGAKPLVIVLPIWGIHAYPSDTIAAGLTERAAGAINVLQILGKNSLFDWDALSNARSEAEFLQDVDRMVGRFANTVIDIRRVVDWAQTQPDIDPSRIALIGFSMGALVASVTVANEPRLAAGVLVMGGADPHEILAACNREIKDARERVLSRLDWSLDEFRRKLGTALTRINPARFAGMVDPRRVLIIEAGEDTCVPRSARERLWHAFGRPERIAYRYDHRTAFLAMTFLGGNSLQQQVYRFLDHRLG
jgi:dienelactone hydrolase